MPKLSPKLVNASFKQKYPIEGNNHSNADNIGINI